jgi:preprotein translocase subunit YajC
MNLILITSIAVFFVGCPMPPGTEGGGGSQIAAFAPFILIFVIFYLLILRPQQKQSKQRQQMLKGIKRGDNVITSGGLYGKVLNIVDDVITLEIAKGVNVRVSRAGISGLAGTNGEDDKAKEEKSQK